MQQTPAGRPVSTEFMIMSALLLLVPATLVGAHLGWPVWLQFFLAVGAVIPLAAYIGWATEALADRLGGKMGGLLNATFGNAPDLLVGVFGVSKGLIPLVKATLIGGLISNSALIMGLCYLVAGLRYRRPVFRREEAGHHSVLLMLTIAAVLFPSVAALTPCPGPDCTNRGADILTLSIGIALVLLVAYSGYVVFGIFGWEGVGQTQPEGREARAVHKHPQEAAKPGRSWSPAVSLLVLGAATAALIPVTDILTDSVAPVTEVLGWTEVFVGMLIVANAGNAAEAYAALRLASERGGTGLDRGGDSGLDLALAIASASSIQIATFVTPLVVLYSRWTATPMNLVFSPVEIAILALLVVIFSFIGQDGESNWLEGLQLLVLYAMAAMVFYALPVSVFGG